LPDFNQNLTFSTDFQKFSNIKLDEKPSSGNRVVFRVGRRVDRRTDKKTNGRTDTTKLTVAFRNFANAP